MDKKRGGSLVLTVIRNIKGDLSVRFRNILLVINEMEAEKLVVFVKKIRNTFAPSTCTGSYPKFILFHQFTSTVFEHTVRF